MDKSRIMIGSMLWILQGEDSAELEEDIRGMVENRLEIARVMIGPGSVIDSAGNYDFSVWDDTFRLAEQYGLLLTPTLTSLTSPKGQSVEAYLAAREKLMECNRRIISRYSASPVLHSWILQNEPRVTVLPNAVTLPLFRRWLLEERYGWDLESLRLRYDHPSVFRKNHYVVDRKSPSEAEKEELRSVYADFSQTIGTINPDGSGSLPDAYSAYPIHVDWGAFNAYILNSQLQEVCDLVHSLDPVHPTTINPDNVAGAYPHEEGRNLYEEGNVVDFLGCSCHPAWHSTRFPTESIDHSVSMFSDLTRSATADPDGYFWVTELQAGTNFFSGGRPLCPSAGDITRWLWSAIGSGCRGMIYWLYRSRPAGFEGLEWGLMNQRGKPSRRSRASAAVAEILAANRELFAGTRPASNDVYILHSFDSMNLASIETDIAQGRLADITDPRNAQMIQDALCGAYLMAADNGWQPGFVWECSLEKLPRDGILLAPNTYALSTETLEKLASWVENGGTLIADGLFGAKTPQGYSSPEVSEDAIARMTGHPADDWTVDIAPFGLTLTEGGELPGWYLKVNWEDETGLRVLARDPEGYASVVQRQCGRGKVLMIGTLFFSAYFAGISGAEAAEFLGKQIHIDKTYMLKNPGKSVTLRVLEGESSDVLIVINHGEPYTAALFAPGGGYDDLLTGERFDELCTIPLDAGQVRVLKHDR